MDCRGRANGLQTVCPVLAFCLSKVVDQKFKPFNRPGIATGSAIAGAILGGYFDLPELFEHLSDVFMIVQREDKPAFN